MKRFFGLFYDNIEIKHWGIIACRTIFFIVPIVSFSLLEEKDLFDFLDAFLGGLLGYTFLLLLFLLIFLLIFSKEKTKTDEIKRILAQVGSSIFVIATSFAAIINFSIHYEEKYLETIKKQADDCFIIDSKNRHLCNGYERLLAKTYSRLSGDIEKYAKTKYDNNTSEDKTKELESNDYEEFGSLLIIFSCLAIMIYFFTVSADYFYEIIAKPSANFLKKLNQKKKEQKKWKT